MDSTAGLTGAIPAPTELRVNRTAESVRTLGPGLRVALWVQGCTLGCAGCASTDTWDADAGPTVRLAELAARLEALLAGHEGLTVTGGEPFQQGPAVAELLAMLEHSGALVGRDVLVFTGYAPTAARRRCPELWGRADALVAGPYLPHRAVSCWLRASDNQQLVLNSERARERYAAPPAGRRMQVAMSGDDVTMAGLPAAGDLDRFRERMAARGITMEDGVSWRT